MKKISIITCLLLFTAGFASAQNELNITGKVTVHETDNDGKHFSYVIVNEGEETIEGGTYRVYLKVNKKYISFDRNTSDLEPGKAVRYESNRVYHKDPKTDELKYTLELTQKKPKNRKKLEEGTISL
ncbi:hypothetical protein [Anditalea andensis]|uniref:Uncharacterized protein n=1 Tax=Anditalea andensis TaxID=1048983 RepID=A0A074LGS2_9BACT|nr:hypothetical protein [Anditalea andensis]KEO72987.1 hypothetical protein EL17_15345 [Anditalea andensis]